MTVPRSLYDEAYYKTNCEGWELPPGQLSKRLKSYEGWVDKELDKAPGQTVIDLGFGRGEISIVLSRHPNVKKVLAIDYSLAAGHFLLSLMRDAKAVLDKIDVIITDASQFLRLLKDTEINHIVAFDVIEHLVPNDIVTIFRHAARLMPKDGKIFVITPVTQAPPNERHVWLARKPEDLRQFGVGFDFRHLGFTGSGEDHKFEFTKL
jgi:cyclopropane fatty-acyl-phospholipid synthase-like methyltransferase